MQAVGSCVFGATSRRGYALVIARGYATSSGAAPTSQKKRENKPSSNNFASLLDERATKFEHKDLFIVPAEDIRHTFVEVNAKVNGLARGFVENIIRPGDTIVSLLPDTSAQLYSQLAAARAGATFVPYSPNVSTEALIKNLKSTNARGCLVPDVIGNRNYIKEMYAALPELDAVVEELQPFRSRYELPNLRMLAHSSDKRYQGFLRLAAIPVTALKPDPLRKVTPSAEEPALILPQAGGALDKISQSNLINTGHAILEALSITTADRIALATQYESIGYYIAAGCISHGAALVQPSKSFNADSVVKSIGRDKCTILVASAKDLPSILQSKELARTDVSSLCAVVAWGKYDAGVASLLKEKLKVKDVFSLDHVSGHTGQLTGVIFTGADKAIVLPGVEARVVDAADKAGNFGTIGTLKTKGAHGLTKDSWVDTKVQAKMDSNGDITFLTKA